MFRNFLKFQRCCRRALNTDVSASPTGVQVLESLYWKERDMLLWSRLQEEAMMLIDEPMLGEWFESTILASSSLHEAISSIVARKMSREMADTRMRLESLEYLTSQILANDERIGADIIAIMSRDPAAMSYLQVVQFFKGFHAVQAQRCAHAIWKDNDKNTALALQDRVNELWQVDIHPAAQLGGGLMCDHATGLVIGETAVVGRDCTILHNVTLGGIGHDKGVDRHPKLGDRVTIGAGATLVGPIRIESDVVIGSQAVVSINVPTGLVVVGRNSLLNPSRSTARKAEVLRRPITWIYETSSEA
uniref:serine O-acetyltransferase n=1 Tax=Aureoumbra lagunensis TaxID=44058 RepID=A0A7S3JRU9_9STRA|eukprot:CAMPEP_0197308108 /NCGR_PEP_ID=MMETSP0891-20130614/6346_1 /TAXON_ID=44058 ORGANISM="Aureoumbra lagunensis, Strain CCMP1510" /NCGR_SAMPLE_ID=MMETSP0891 /ASSEMBLY_ACC=CAM_ASM_000534 /LENGTH=303 /DNA_ID=CAMNT_0042792215 /DNA_START=59 /DNA_END=970 /DNA_ORIENTATION=+